MKVYLQMKDFNRYSFNNILNNYFSDIKETKQNDRGIQ